MIVATSEDGKTIIIGLCPADYATLKTGQTLIKSGGKLFGFRSLVIFEGASNEANLNLLNTHAGTKRQDDPKDFNMG